MNIEAMAPRLSYFPWKSEYKVLPKQSENDYLKDFHGQSIWEVGNDLNEKRNSDEVLKREKSDII